MIQMNSLLTKFTFTDELTDVIENCKGVVVPTSKAELYDMVFGPEHADVYDVVFDVPGKGLVKEADVVRCKNGASVNFVEDYMRRREPDCMRIADDKPTDKKRFADVYGYKFDKLRRETMDWFKTQELILMPFNSGGNQYGYGSMLVCPKRAHSSHLRWHICGLCKRRGDRGLQAACDHLCCTSVPSHPLRRQAGRCSQPSG